MTQSSNLGAVATSTGAVVRAGFNNGVQALASDNEGSSAPSPTYPFMKWRNSAAGQLKRRNSLNSGWEIIENYAASTDPGTGDDASVGYIRGSVWINTSTNRMWWCLDPTTASARWLALGAPRFDASQVLSVSATNTTTPQTLATWTLPANTFYANGQGIDFELVGTVQQNSGTDTGAALRLRIGATNICADPMAALTNNGTARPYILQGRIWRASSSRVKAWMEIAVHAQGTPTAGRGDLAAAPAITPRAILAAGAGVAADWSTDQTFTIDWAMSVANAANIVTAEYLKTSLLG